MTGYNIEINREGDKEIVKRNKIFFYFDFFPGYSLMVAVAVRTVTEELDFSRKKEKKRKKKRKISQNKIKIKERENKVGLLFWPIHVVKVSSD